LHRQAAIWSASISINPRRPAIRPSAMPGRDSLVRPFPASSRKGRRSAAVDGRQANGDRYVLATVRTWTGRSPYVSAGNGATDAARPSESTVGLGATAVVDMCGPMNGDNWQVMVGRPHTSSNRTDDLRADGLGRSWLGNHCLPCHAPSRPTIREKIPTKPGHR
jgi:hypothetical protein